MPHKSKEERQKKIAEILDLIKANRKKKRAAQYQAQLARQERIYINFEKHLTPEEKAKASLLQSKGRATDGL